VINVVPLAQALRRLFLGLLSPSERVFHKALNKYLVREFEKFFGDDSQLACDRKMFAHKGANRLQLLEL
jgi:hypothetical protein